MLCTVTGRTHLCNMSIAILSATKLCRQSGQMHTSSNSCAGSQNGCTYSSNQSLQALIVDARTAADSAHTKQ